MRNFKLVGLCLVVVFAISAVVASVASATKPEFNNAATESMMFTSEGGAVTFKITGGISMKCTASTDEGEILSGASKKEGSVTFRFTGCKLGGVYSCNSISPLGRSEELITHLLAMRLGYINKATPEVGVDFSAATLAEIECPEVKDIIKITGSVISVITPLNVLTNVFTFKFAESGGVQVPTSFEGGKEDTLKSSINGGTPLASTATTEDTVKLSEKGQLEIIA